MTLWFIVKPREEQVRVVLERLKQFGLTANPRKCVWGVAVIDYLGHTVGRGKVQGSLK